MTWRAGAPYKSISRARCSEHPTASNYRQLPKYDDGTETKKDLLEHIRVLQERLDEAEETLRALRSGEVDAVVASGPEGDRVYTLKGADEAYRVMVENMAEGALTLTRDGLILFSNEQFASMIGIPLERVIGSSVQDFIAAEDTLVLSALLGHSSRAEAQLRLKKDPAAQVPVHLSANTLLFDETECVCLIVTDLTEQQRNQEIVAAERLARSILDQAAGAILVVDPAGKIIRASRAAGKLANTTVLLRPFDEVFSLRINSDAIANSIAMDYTFEQILSTLQRHGSVADLEATARVPDGPTRDVIVSAGLLTGAHSECLGCIVQISDVSRLKRAEQEIRSLNADLERRVRFAHGGFGSYQQRTGIVCVFHRARSAHATARHRWVEPGGAGGLWRPSRSAGARAPGSGSLGSPTHGTAD